MIGSPATRVIGVPVKIIGNVRISFSGGKNRSRWRLQHTGSDQDGGPLAIGWTDVTALSDLRLDDPRSVIEDDVMIGGFLGEWIDGPNGNSLPSLQRNFFASHSVRR